MLRAAPTTGPATSALGRAAASVSVLGLLLLAGCLGAAPAPEPAAAADPAATAPPSATVPLAWELTDCQAIAWEVLVPASRLSPRLPDGFAPSPAAGTEAATPQGVEQAATLAFEAIECARGFGSEEQVARSIPYARLSTPVVPPGELRDGRSGTQHAYTWAVLVADDAWRARLAAEGLPVHDGGALVGPAAQGWSGRVVLDGLGTFSLTGRTDASDGTAPDQPVRDFTAADSGLAAWVGTRSERVVSAGVGVWEVTPGSWVADVLATTQGVAAFTLSTWSATVSVLDPGSGNGEPLNGGIGSVPPPAP